jgi:hypothetical protein
MSFQLLVEKLRDGTGHPAKSEIAILTNSPDDVARLIQRTYNQPLGRSTAEIEPGIPSPIADCSRQEPNKGVHDIVLVSGHGCNRGQSGCQRGGALRLGHSRQGPYRAEQDGGTYAQMTGHEERGKGRGGHSERSELSR